MNGVLATLDRQALIARRAHPGHGRILQVFLTDDGRRRLDGATPAVRAVEKTLESGLSGEEVARIKDWLVAVARRLDGATAPDAS